MAATYKYSDILTIAAKSLNRTVEDHFSSIACNLATNLIWNAYDWHEAMAVLPPFYLVPNEQDHGTPPIVVPTDLQGLRKVQVCQYVDGNVSKSPLVVLKDLQLTHVKSLPTAISYEPSSRAFRVHPRIPENIGSPLWFIEGTYKKRPAKITNATLDTTFPFDDMEFDCGIQALRWALMLCANSPQAGQAQMNGSQVVYTGQLANAMAAIEQMAANEGFNDGDIQISPASPLVPGTLGSPYNYGLFIG